MKLHYFISKRGNFGDDLNSWIWDNLIPGWQEWDHDVTLLGVGTLINDRAFAEHGHKRILTLGTGVGYGDDIVQSSIPSRWDFASVRGRRSARQLGLDETRGLVDPAVLVADFPEFQDLRKSKFPVFIPHHVSVARHNWAKVCDKYGVKYVSPELNSGEVIKEIASAPLVIAESMHAAIIADSFRVPWIPIRINPKFNADKWIDVFESLGLDVDIPYLFPQVEQLANRYAQPRLRRYQRRIRVVCESFVIDQAFEEALQITPFLGNSKRLAVRKAAYLEVLKDAQAKYA